MKCFVTQRDGAFSSLYSDSLLNICRPVSNSLFCCCFCLCLMVSAISANENKMCAMNDANVDVDEICFASICFDDPKRWHISVYIIKKNYSQSGDI